MASKPRAFAAGVLLAATAVSGRGQECELTVPEWAPRGSANRARPRIAATFSSTCGTAIDRSSVQMIVDEKPVTPTTEGRGATVTVAYVPEAALLEEADHTVTVRARDERGVAGARTWTFHLPATYLR
jgi:hypothetical protein